MIQKAQMTRTLLVLALAVLVGTSAVSGGENDIGDPGCRPLELGAGDAGDVSRALRARQDVWGNALLRTKSGPTYHAASRYLRPLLLARAPGRASLTASGYHYVAFAHPSRPQRSGSAALHVADGSQILWQRSRGPSLTIRVGVDGSERFGSCASRLALPRLVDGYLPVLRTRYVDSERVRYRQESFAARVGSSPSLVSFVRLTADARQAHEATEIRFAPSGGPALSYEVRAGSSLDAYVSWTPAGAEQLDRAAYEAARAAAIRYWQARLGEGATIDVPERLVRDAARSLIVQNLVLTWRYSVGNPYQQFSFPEGIDVAQVLSAHGHADVASAILRRSLETPGGPYASWRVGQKLVGTALQYRLFRDRSLVEEMTPALRRAVADLSRRLDRRRNLLRRERYSSDVPNLVYGLHSQAVVWQGLCAMGRVWAQVGERALAATSRRLAARLEIGLRSAIRLSQRTLDDGSLFVPVRLLDSEPPYRSVTETRAGSYWNLVMPYALASGILPPRSREARGVLRYLELHGARLLGLVRAGAYSLYGRRPEYPTSGVNPVYGLNMARFLADNDRPDQLVLSLYGQLAAGMAPGTHVAGEAASVAPIPGDPFRSMYLPPNGASNASFLETLRLMLVHETRDRRGTPRGLELAFATPRAWLAPGRRIAVRSLPTSFGPLAYTITSRADTVHVVLDVPARSRPRVLRLRLRLPRETRVRDMRLAGRPFRRFDPDTETIDLSGRSGRLVLAVDVARS